MPTLNTFLRACENTALRKGMFGVCLCVVSDHVSDCLGGVFVWWVCCMRCASVGLRLIYDYNIFVYIYHFKQ